MAVVRLSRRTSPTPKSLSKDGPQPPINRNPPLRQLGDKPRVKLGLQQKKCSQKVDEMLPGKARMGKACSEQDFSGPTNTEPAFYRIPGLRHYQ